MTRRSATTGVRAMTLLEVMFALAILVVLSAGVMGFFFQITARRDQLVRLASQQRDVSLLFDRVEAALLGAVAVAPDGSAGIVGDDTSLTIATRGVHPALGDEAALTDTCIATFSFDERSAGCIQTVAASDGSSESLSESLLGLVERVRFRYSNGRDWVSSFDSVQAGGLPVAVEVSVWFEPRVPRPEPADSSPAGSSGFEGSFPESDSPELGPLDLPPPEPAEPVWIPREPDHLRVIGVPDAPAWQERES